MVKNKVSMTKVRTGCYPYSSGALSFLFSEYFLF